MPRIYGLTIVHCQPGDGLMKRIWRIISEGQACSVWTHLKRGVYRMGYEELRPIALKKSAKLNCNNCFKVANLNFENPRVVVARENGYIRIIQSTVKCPRHLRVPLESELIARRLNSCYGTSLSP